MFRTIQHTFQLLRAGRTLARHGVLTPPDRDDAEIPLPARAAIRMLGLGSAGRHQGPAGESHGERLSGALAELGPSYIKLGQFLATRPDVIGKDMSIELSELHDRLPPFAMDKARAEIERALGTPAGELFEELGEPVAAASIAQVHKARAKGDDGIVRDVAVKVLRPGIEQRFARDLGSFFFAARHAERFSAEGRRLRPVAAVETLARSVELEMDLRLEAAAISEMAENTARDPGFRVPTVDWTRTARRVLTTEWIDGIPLNDLAAIEKAGHDFKALSRAIIQSFLRHAMRDGFFHADMHQGNLFVGANGDLIAVDFGIMGRLSPKDRRFLAEILYGFINRDYARVAAVHFDAGYVPPDQSRELFAQALRAIGEPLMERTAADISMARLLEQLFQVTGQFNMHTQPQLLLLQKTMVVVEGVARTFDPDLNMWEIAEPVVKEWMETRLGPEGRLQEAAEGAATLARLLGDLPELLSGAERAAEALGAGRPQAVFAEVPDHPASAHGAGGSRWALWIAAAALVVIAVAQLF